MIDVLLVHVRTHEDEMQMPEWGVGGGACVCRMLAKGPYSECASVPKRWEKLFRWTSV